MPSRGLLGARHVLSALICSCSTLISSSTSVVMATQSEVGGPCSDSSGCYSAEACLGGYCCNFADSHMTPSSGMWENFYYCNSCGEGDGVCTACQETHFLKSGSQYGAYCAEVCDDDQYQSGSILSYCTDKKQAGVGCSSDEQCLSGKCGGDYCCDDSTCDKKCDGGSGACSTKSEVGGPCSDSSGCYSAEACLGGYCCNFADSHMTPSSGMWENFYYCNSCGEGDGVCTACQETHFLKSGSQYGAYCAEVCDDDQYQSGSILSYCTDKKQAGVGCSSDEQCLSGKCGGDYCCDDSTCDKKCDGGSGACSTKSEVGGPCSDSSGCYSAEACLGGYCCNFADSHMTPSSGMWENFYYCNSCGEGDGVCTACQETHFLKSGSQYGAYCAEVCDDDQYQSGSILSYCTDKKQAGVGCSSDEQCLSGKCGGDYCCDDSASSQNDGFGYVCELCRSLVGDCVSKQRILCSENEYVSSNYCLTCPAGSFNAADEDASGVDTTCDVSPTPSPPPAAIGTPSPPPSPPPTSLGTPNATAVPPPPPNAIDVPPPPSPSSNATAVPPPPSSNATAVPPPPPSPSPPTPPKSLVLADYESSAGRFSVLTALVVSLLSLP